MIDNIITPIIPQKNGVFTPGLTVYGDDVERYVVKNSGLLALSLDKDDICIIQQTDGAQPCELILFDEQGRVYTAVNTTCLINDAPIFKKHLGCYPDIKKRLEGHAFILQAIKAIRLFDAQALANDERIIAIEQTCHALIVSDNKYMSPWAQDAACDIVVYIKRAIRHNGQEYCQAPAPLAQPRLDHNIQAGQAFAYTVKKGEYVQILDVQGRECSDFQAFSLRDLDKGIEQDIDPTTTRSLMGSLYPTPGLFAKYYNNSHHPLLEIIEDTCGRHDSFGLACFARYYEDLGYPGHANCSDNINKAVREYSITERTGWAAINFFFNTMLDSNHAIMMDDPWSRPGDYVLLRALSDLVCVSTACPCDVDPANGWNPTDIQVRTYKETEMFKRSIGWRKTEASIMQQTQETSFHSSFAQYTRDFVEYNGYWLANSMLNIGTIGEYWACREKAAIMDLSPLRKYEITGPDAEQLMQLCVTRNIKKLSVGQVVYTAMCYAHGGMIDDGTIFRLGEGNFRWVGGNDDSGLWLKQQALAHNLNAYVRDSTNNLANIAVQGPLSRDILAPIFWTPPTQPTIEELGWFRFTIARIGDYHGVPVVISRTGYSGELGYEIFVAPNDAATVFDAIMQVGKPLGLTPLGLEALNILRVEAGLIFAGYEFSDQTDPFEAGIGFTVPLKTQDDNFIGRNVLEQRQATPQRRLIGLEVDGGIVPTNGDCLRVGKAQVGEITSAVKSPILGKVIALARCDVTHADVGTTLEIGQLDGLQKRLKAIIVPFPHFDPAKERVKGNYS